MQIDFEKIRSVINFCLPHQAQWMINDTSLDFDFSLSDSSLQPVSDNDIEGGQIPNEWAGCWLFGKYVIAQGGGSSPWIAFRERDGFICGLDIERNEEKLFLFNSSLDRFISSFALFDQYLRDGQTLPLEFTSQLEALDPDVFEVSEWKDLANMITTT